MSKSSIPKTLKWQVLHRDNYTCRYCGSRGVPMAIDHVWPESKGGPTIYENLVTACEPCNSRKKDRLGIYPRPVDYLDKLNQADQIIAWYRDYHRELLEQQVAKRAAVAEKLMSREFARMERAFRFRRIVFWLVRLIPVGGFAFILIAGVLLLALLTLLNTGRLPQPGLLIIPYAMFGLSLVFVPVHKKALNWYCAWPYPRYDIQSEEIQKELVKNG